MKIQHHKSFSSWCLTDVNWSFSLIQFKQKPVDKLRDQTKLMRRCGSQPNVLFTVTFTSAQDIHQDLLASIFNLVPLPKMILNWFPVFTQHQTPWHKLNPTSLRTMTASMDPCFMSNIFIFIFIFTELSYNDGVSLWITWNLQLHPDKTKTDLMSSALIIFMIYDQYSLASTVNLVPRPKKIL